MGLIAAGMCDIGLKRKTNQDSIYLNPEKNIFIVADGMGGHNGGDIASAMAVKYVPEFLLSNANLDPVEACRESIRYTNKTIKERGAQDPKLVGMGTTVVGFYFKGATVYIPNVGDSRAYLVNNHKIFQLTKDHSLVQEKLNVGIYTREQAQKDPQKNVLVRTVGFDDEVEVDVFSYKVSKNDIFITCSDGLHGRVSDADILYIVNTHIPDPMKATKETVNKTVQTLVAQANKNGGNDNISVVLVVAQ
jgi:serine/threonine protein phosphatase PrpC